VKVAFVLERDFVLDFLSADAGARSKFQEIEAQTRELIIPATVLFEVLLGLRRETCRPPGSNGADARPEDTRRGWTRRGAGRALLSKG
jgi:hypothetical protein